MAEVLSELAYVGRLRFYQDESGNLTLIVKVDGGGGGGGGASAEYNVTPPTLADGASSSLQLTAKGDLKTALVDPATGALVTYSDLGEQADTQSASITWSTQNKALITRLLAGACPTAAFRLLSAAASDNAVNIKASGGNVHKLQGRNAAAATRYLKLYNKATAPVSTDAPVLTIELAASAVFDLDLRGLYLATGIGMRITTGQADNDTGVLTAADIVSLNLSYA
jgi:hypothetical protein